MKKIEAMNRNIIEELFNYPKCKDNPFSGKNIVWVKRIGTECTVRPEQHNFGIKKDGYCANCGGNELIKINNMKS